MVEMPFNLRTRMSIETMVSSFNTILLTITLTLFGLMQSYSQAVRPSKQDVLNKFGFAEYLIVTGSDTTFFYLYKNKSSQPRNLVLFLHGTLTDPLFSVEEESGKYVVYRSFPGDYRLLKDDYCYAVISKTGIPSIGYGEIKYYTKYHQYNSLDHRVMQADLVINYIVKKLTRKVNHVIVYGHSEGAPVAAKLCTKNKRITHLGYWAGNALPDYFDFLLENSKLKWTNQLSDSAAFENTKSILASFEAISKNRDDVRAKGKDDYSSKRWWSYAEPPLNNLLKISLFTCR